MGMDTKSLVRLGEALADLRGLTVSTISNYAANDGKVLGRLASGADMTSRRIAGIAQWFSDNWPPDAEWPADIPRPDPSPGSPAVPLPAPPADPLAATRAAHEAMMDASGADRVDWNEVQRHERAMYEAAVTLGADARIASVEALCLALRLPRATIDDTIRRFRDGRHKGVPPRQGSDAWRAWKLLVASGDARFTSWRQDAA